MVDREERRIVTDAPISFSIAINKQILIYMQTKVESVFVSFNKDLNQLPHKYECEGYLSNNTVTIYLDYYADEVVNLVAELVSRKYSGVLELVDDEFDKIVYKIVVE